MEFDQGWILLGLPIAFALGWLASRFDLRQLRLDNQRTPKAYFKGLNHLLNEHRARAEDGTEHDSAQHQRRRVVRSAASATKPRDESQRRERADDCSADFAAESHRGQCACVGQGQHQRHTESCAAGNSQHKRRGQWVAQQDL